MSRDHLRSAFYDDQLRALNRLVAAVERLEAPALPEVPPWENSPKDPGDLDDNSEELRGVAEEWMAWASELDDILGALDFEEFEDALAGLQSKAKEARLALIAVGAYDPPPPGGS